MFAVVAFGLLLVGAGQATAANIVLNGSFDADNPPGGTAPLDWTLTPAASGTDFFVGPGPDFRGKSRPRTPPTLEPSVVLMTAFPRRWQQWLALPIPSRTL